MPLECTIMKTPACVNLKGWQAGPWDAPIAESQTPRCPRAKNIWFRAESKYCDV